MDPPTDPLVANPAAIDSPESSIPRKRSQAPSPPTSPDRTERKSPVRPSKKAFPGSPGPAGAGEVAMDEEAALNGDTSEPAMTAEVGSGSGRGKTIVPVASSSAIISHIIPTSGTTNDSNGPPSAAASDSVTLTVASLVSESAAHTDARPESSSSTPQKKGKDKKQNGRGDKAGGKWEGKKVRGEWEGKKVRGEWGKKGDKAVKGGDGETKAGGSEENDGQKDDGEGEGSGRLPKKRCAILLGYCGTGYSGMQLQPGDTKTIEGDIFAALVKAGAVSADNSDDPRKVDVQRAARTDAGVHAAGNVISMKLIFDPPRPAEYPDLASYVNSFLPQQIRMWGFVKAMKSFQARTSCDSRIYEYLFPSYCLLPPSRNDALAKHLDESSAGWRERLGAAAEFTDAMPVLPEVTDEEMSDPRQRGEYERRRGWRVDEGSLKRLKSLVAEYAGTHNYHNYTVGKPFNDRTVKRYMIQLDVHDPAVYGDIEWISVIIHGQSFQLHQIRKMISLAMLACRTGSPPALIPETFGPKRIHIPKAPPLGLLLEAPQFRTYNSRIETNSSADDREPVDFGLHAKAIHDFKVKYIYEKLRQEELETHTFHKWIRQMDCSSLKGLSFLNTQGIIPPEAQIVGREKKAPGPGKEEKNDKDEPHERRNEEPKVFEESDEEVDEEQLKRGELEG